MFCLFNLGGAPNYFPNSFGGPDDKCEFKECPFKVSGDVQRYETGNDDNFGQVTTFWTKVNTDLKFY